MVGQLPVNWERVSLGDVADIQGGIPLRAKRRAGYRRLSCLSVADGARPYFELDDEDYAELFDDELEHCALADRDLLVVKEDGGKERLERAVLWRRQSSDCLCQNHRIRVRPTARLDPAFLQHLWNSRAAWWHTTGRCRAAC